MNIDRRGGLERGIVVRLVQGDGKDLQLAVTARSLFNVSGIEIAAAGAGARQWMPNPRLGRKNRSRAVAVMDIQVHGHGAADPALLVHELDGHGDVMNHAKALTVVGKGMMEAAPNVQRDALAQRQVRSQNRATGGKPEG